MKLTYRGVSLELNKTKITEIKIMKYFSLIMGITLGTYGGLFSESFSENLIFNALQASAETSLPSCPLPIKVAITFSNAQCRAVKLQMPQTFFRYYSNEEHKKGNYLTTEQYSTNVEAMVRLALPPNFQNKATKMVSVTLPAGITVYQGFVAPQSPVSCYIGGGQQTFIRNEDLNNPNIKWTDGPDTFVEEFNCSFNITVEDN